MNSQPAVKRIFKAIIAALLLCIMVSLLLVWQWFPMPVFVLLITLGFIAFGLLVKSLLTVDEES